MHSEGATVVVVGAGHVGSAFAFALLRSRLVERLVLTDAELPRAQGEAMDLAHAVPFGPPIEVEAVPLDAVPRADVTVVTAGVAQRPGETRVALARRNAGILRGIARGVADKSPDGIIIVATNPVDAMTWLLWKETGLSPRAVFGSGTVLDSARFRSMLSAHAGVDARSIHAHIVGEHGDSEVPLWSLATVGGAPFSAFCEERGAACDPQTRAKLFAATRDAAYEIIERKGSTAYAIAAALVRVVEAVLRNERSVLPVSSVIDGAYGIEGVCLSLPSIVDETGVAHVLRPEITPSELAALRLSAAAVRRVIDDVTG